MLHACYDARDEEGRLRVLLIRRRAGGPHHSVLDEPDDVAGKASSLNVFLLHGVDVPPHFFRSLASRLALLRDRHRGVDLRRGGFADAVEDVEQLNRCFGESLPSLQKAIRWREAEQRLGRQHLGAHAPGGPDVDCRVKRWQRLPVTRSRPTVKRNSGCGAAGAPATRLEARDRCFNLGAVSDPTV
eukprot:gene10217-biopygen11063